MKKGVMFLLVFVMLFSSLSFAGRLTEKVDKLMETNQDRERTYYPRDAQPNNISILGGPPLLNGVAISHNINEMIALGVGAGAFWPGFVADLFTRVYILPTSFSPYVGGGLSYVTSLGTDSLVCFHVEGGLDYVLENGINLFVGFSWLKSFAETSGTFDVAWGSTLSDINFPMIQGGLGYRF